MNYTLYIYH